MTDRKKALSMCLLLDNGAEDARTGNLTAARARQVLAEMVKLSSGEDLIQHSIKGWLEEWLESKAGDAAPATMARYKQVVRDFLKCIGPRANARLATISTADILKFRNEQRSGGRTATTVNMVVRKVLSVPLERARRLGYIPTNPCHGVDPIKDWAEKDEAAREPFAGDELKALLAATKARKGEASLADWKGMILISATTGLRIGDVSKLVWENIDLSNQTIKVTTKKNKVKLLLPMHPDVLDWIHELDQGVGKAPLMPTLHSKNVSGCNGLSLLFRALMDRAGITCKVALGKGEKGRRRYTKSYHSLRHSASSFLLNAGVSAEIGQKITGHSSEEMLEHYQHLSLEAAREAIHKIPSLTK